MDALAKNQLHTVTIDGWSSDGSGVAHVFGRAVFVKGAVPGEDWVVRIVKVTSAAVFARGERLLTPSPHRIEPDCPVFGKCGGCVLRHVDYEMELEFKLGCVNDAYKHIGGLDLRADTIIGAENVDGYRNKGIYTVADGPRSGFFRPRSHELIPVDRCLIQSESADRAVRAVCEFMRENSVPAYDEETGQGLVRRVFTRNGLRSGEMLVIVVAARGFGAKTGKLVEAIRRAVPEATGIILNVNKNRGNTVLSGDFYTLWGSGTIRDRLCGLEFELSPLSFYQVNPAQAEKLYELVLDYAAPYGRGLILDLYCGAGTISLCLTRGCERVIGAEIVPEAVENARENARRNTIGNVEFICADAGQSAAALAARGEYPDAVVVDPPRKGLSTQVIDAVCSLSPERVVYVSCNAATQARDLVLFLQHGYTPVHATAVDMFPRTSHVETVVLLSKGEIDSQKIRVEFSLEAMDMSGFRKGATYDDIKAYVLEKF